ncbi:MAG: nickel-dependent lactate racemase [Anaerolineales bacterium]
MVNQQIWLPYGKNKVKVEIPQRNISGVYYPKKFVEEIEEGYILRQAMQNPVGSRRLREIVRAGQTIAIVTSDLTRPTPTDKMLPFIVEELEAAGIPDKDIFIVFALGIHRPMSDAEMRRAISPAYYQRFQAINHNPDDVVRLGVTRRGTPVDIFRPLVEADIRICLGNIEFHYFAGFSGGAKAILPGCASRETIYANHRWMVTPEAVAMRIDGNPIREDLEEGVELLGVDFILNVIVDSQHRIVAAFAGDVIAAHRAGCQVVIDRGAVDIPCCGDIVIASPGGYPKDINLLQANKALQSAKDFVRDGGIIILVAECQEGFGNSVMEQWMREIPTPDEAIRRIEEKFVQGGHIAAAIALIEKKAKIYCVSAFPNEVVNQIRWTPFETVQDAIDDALQKLGNDSRVIVLPEATSIVARLSE